MLDIVYFVFRLGIIIVSHCFYISGGNAKIRPYWKNYFENTDVLIFVVSIAFFALLYFISSFSTLSDSFDRIKHEIHSTLPCLLSLSSS